jgi:hypothetical protein
MIRARNNRENWMHSNCIYENGCRLACGTRESTLNPIPICVKEFLL